MGDRANIGFIGAAGGDCVWLYTHWDGSNLPDLARTAILAAQPRWGDAPYATRMALTAMISNITSDTGWGVDTQPGENEHDALVIDWNTRTVGALDADDADNWYKHDEAQRRFLLANTRQVSFNHLEANPRALHETAAWQ